MSKPRVLITGGAGFIGSHLAELFLDRDHDVVVMDNLLTGRLENIEHLFGRPGFTFHDYDVTNYIHISGRLDSILHFASPASPNDYLEYPIQTLKSRVFGDSQGARVGQKPKVRDFFWLQLPRFTETH